MTKEENPYGVKIGEVWVDNDKRYFGERRIRVLCFGTTQDDYPAAQVENLQNGRKTWVKLNRFNDRLNYGYSRANE
jgi:hypothetical protein